MTYYWYSTQQAAILNEQHYRIKADYDREGNFVTLRQEEHTYKPLRIKGNQGLFTGLVHEYTEMTYNSKPSGMWKDYYLVAIIDPATSIEIGDLEWSK